MSDEPTDKPPIRPGLKTALELGPVLLFFVGYLLLKDRHFLIGGRDYQGFVVMTAAFVPVLALSTAILWKLTGKLSTMQVVTLVLVVVFGGLTIWFNDPRFFKMKVTLIYGLFAAVLGFGLMRGRSYLQLVMGEALPLRAEGWMILTKRLALFFAGLAVANEVIWRSFSEEFWVSFKTFGLTGLVIVFFLTQAKLFEAYAIEKKDEG